MKKLRERLARFFFPASDSPRRVPLLPYAALGVLTLATIAGGVYRWKYTDSSKLCSTACHTSSTGRGVQIIFACQGYL